MPDTPIQDYPRGLTFEQVWAALMEDRQQMQKMQEKTDREWRILWKSQLRTDRQIKKMSKNLGGLGDSIGGLIETLVAAKLWEKFSSYSYEFKRAYRRVQVFDDINNRELTDIDILLSDTKWAMAVEVKREVVLKDVERHIKRMNIISTHPPAEVKGKKLLGAMAGGTIESEASDLAYESGFFVLQLRGESVELVSPPEGFKPTEW